MGSLNREPVLRPDPFLVFAHQPARAADSAPTQLAVVVEFEWGAIEGADGYEVKLTPKSGGTPSVFKTQENKISQRVPAGRYNLQVRSREKGTGYYGPWGRVTEIEAVAKIAELVAPADNDVIPEPERERLPVLFKWNPIPGASRYLLRVWGDDPSQAEEYSITQTQRQLQLSGGEVYHWQVTLEDENSVDYEANAKVFSFSILGKRLLPPVVDSNVGLPHVTRVAWSGSVDAETYSAKLLSRALDESDWKPQAETKDLKETQWSFQELKPGQYRIEVTASAKKRMASKPGVFEFTVKPPAALVSATQGLAAE